MKNKCVALKVLSKQHVYLKTKKFHLYSFSLSRTFKPQWCRITSLPLSFHIWWEQNPRRPCRDTSLTEPDKGWCSISDDLTAHKLDANPCADAIQIEPRHQRGHAEQQVIEKRSVSMYLLPASAAQSWSVPLHKGWSVQDPAVCTVCVQTGAPAQLYGAETKC